MAIRSRLLLLVAGALLVSACGAGGAATAPEQTEVVPVDAATACEDWLQADRQRDRLLEYFVREFGGDPNNPNAEPNAESWVVRLAASPFLETYYSQLASLSTGGDRNDLTSYAAAYAEGPVILRDAGVADEVVEAIAATYGTGQARPQVDDQSGSGSLLGLRMGNGVSQFSSRFAGLPSGVEETVDDAVAGTRDRCQSLGA